MRCVLLKMFINTENNMLCLYNIITYSGESWGQNTQISKKFPLKNETCWNYSRNGGWGIKKNDGGNEFKCDIFDILQELL
jgi:hypothetical protein